MALIIASLVALLVLVLAGFFVINAVALRRDINRRFDGIQVRLENEAQSTVDLFLKTDPGNNSN